MQRKRKIVRWYPLLSMQRERKIVMKAYLQTAGLALLAACMIIVPTGCTSASIEKAVSEIDAYLPTAIQLAQIVISAVGVAQSNGLSPDAQNTANTVIADLKELQTLCDSYLSQPQGGTWQNIQNVLETILSANQQQLEAAAGIKSHDAKNAYVAAITSLSAALAVIDGYINTTKTSAQLKTKAQARQAKLSAYVQVWTPQDKARISAALGVPYPVLEKEALAYGL